MDVIKKCCALLMWMHILTYVQSIVSQNCMLESFKQYPLFDENFELSNLKPSYDSGENVRVLCKVGYRGFFRLICSNGKWFHRGEKCAVISCGHPGDAPFAEFRLEKGTDYNFGSQVLYTCLKGYQMVSYVATRNCLQDGWDGHLPECEPIQCQAPPNLDLGKVAVDGDLDRPTFGSVLRFSCRERGDALIGASQIHCDENGEWSGPAPKCQAITCERPQSATFTVEGNKALFKENEHLRYTCKPGYKKMDGRPSYCRKLGVSSQWTPMPECELITCKLSADRPLGTTYDPNNQIIFNPGQSMRVSCGEKDWVKSPDLQSAELRCQNTGSWDYEPVCQPVTCSKHDEKVYSWQRTWDNTVLMDVTLRYECYTGYKPTSPESRARCTRRGWEPSPLCKEKTCSKPSVKNAEITEIHQRDNYRHNDRVEFRCTYQPEVTFTVTCYYGESWYGQRACKEKPCTTIPEITNGEMLDPRRPPYDDRVNVQFRCIGETDIFMVTCKAGDWVPTRLCQEKECTAPPAIKNADSLEQSVNKYEHGRKVQMKCIGLEDSFTVTCQAGEWLPKHECPACGSTAIPNGFSHLADDKLYYSCNEGFKLLSKGWWAVASCVNNKWKTAECIANSDCGPVPNIPNLIVTSENKRFSDGQTIPIHCETGHHNLHSNLKELTCKKGKWDSNGVDFKQICTPIEFKCGTPPKVKNVVIFAPFEKEYLSNTTLTYKCRAGYTTEGEHTIECRNGTWLGNVVACRAQAKDTQGRNISTVDAVSVPTNVPRILNGEQ